MVDPRGIEADLIARCVLAARGALVSAPDERHAQVFRVAADLVGRSHAREAAALRQTAARYLREHALDGMSGADVERRGWILGLARFRAALERALEVA